MSKSLKQQCEALAVLQDAKVNAANAFESLQETVTKRFKRDGVKTLDLGTTFTLVAPEPELTDWDAVVKTLTPEQLESVMVSVVDTSKVKALGELSESVKATIKANTTSKPSKMTIRITR